MTYAYDSQDRLTTITDGLGNTINYTYDSSGNRLKEEIKDPEGVLTKTVSYQYDVLGRLWRVNNPDGNFTEYSYDVLGNQLSHEDPKGNPLTYYDYDPLGRLRHIIQPGDVHIFYDHDSHDNLVSVTDGNGNSTTYVVDDMGRVYQEISPDTGTTTYQYDPAGNMIIKTDARGIAINYSYDALNRLTLVDFPTDTDITYRYDKCVNGKGRVCQVQDQLGTTYYEYSPKGELVQEERLILGINYTTGYQYDDNGNLEVLTYPSGRTVTYAYDNADQITTVLTTPPGGAQQTVASSISYYPFGDVGSLTHGNGLVRAVEYDFQYQMSSIHTDTIQDLTYVPDPNGNIKDIIDNLDSTKSKNYSYDALNRLEGATGPWGDLSWTYDNVGNRVTYTDGDGTTNYSYYTGTNRLQALTGATTSAFTYDANGNTETEDARQYIYNENSRLVEVLNSGSIRGAYTYNANGQRVIKAATETADDVTMTLTTVFHYDLSGNLIGDFGGDYIYLGSYPIGRGKDSDLYFLHTDHLATPRSATDSNGTMVWQLQNRPFGDHEVVSGSSVIINLRFPGQYYDAERGHNQNWHRDYSPKLGRYIQPDPLGVLQGMRWSSRKRNGRNFFNLYGYADENSVMFADRSGLIAGGIGGGVSGVITPPPPYMGIGGEALCYVVIDSKGNIGLLCCAAAGPFFGLGGSAGLQGAAMLCLTCDTICDMPGFFGQVMVTGAVKGGATAGGGVSFGSGGIGVGVNAGPSVGGGGAAGTVAGGCWLALGGEGCKPCNDR